ncbi:MAG TPA: phosphoribosylformylglycinamidine synthase subunit PurQ [Fimbriimonadaceae bacterium]|nr:phosphoribosylformylglycinamidine synthase subunit PurQ [Fimbriimonadaceae bacterium]
MRVAVVQFPGSNCDQDALHALRESVGVAAEYVWHDSDSLSGYDAVFLPGGFSYGDYLRCGAIASRARIMGEVAVFAEEGRPVIGVCNGFQVLCEAGLLPGALLPNKSEKFICRHAHLAAVNRTSMWTRGVEGVLRIPIAHGEGRYICDQETLEMLQTDDRIAFRYVNDLGESSPEANLNGSIDAIAGVLNARGNVLGMMPHPERAASELLGSTDGLAILRALALARV